MGESWLVPNGGVNRVASVGFDVGDFVSLTGYVDSKSFLFILPEYLFIFFVKFNKSSGKVRCVGSGTRRNQGIRNDINGGNPDQPSIVSYDKSLERVDTSHFIDYVFY